MSFRKFNRGTLWLALQLLVGFKLSGIAYNQAATPEDERGSIPNYKVDPSWPKQLPHDWIIGQVGGLTVDQHDHIWVLQRPSSLTVDEKGASLTPPRSMCCFPAPPVMEFDT